MSEVVSFGNIVNSLRAVRNDYNEHLKAVPQYEAFLLVESSAQSVADKLRAVAPAMAADIGEALEATKAKFRQHLTNVPEYRALLAIEKLIGDIAADLGVQPVAASPVEPPVEAAPTISPLHLANAWKLLVEHQFDSGIRPNCLQIRNLRCRTPQDRMGGQPPRLIPAAFGKAYSAVPYGP